MENCLVTKLKGSVDNSDLRFDYLDGFIVRFKPGQLNPSSLGCSARPSNGNVTIHVITGTLYSDANRTTEITEDVSYIGSTRTFYPSLTEDTAVVIFNKKAIGVLNVSYGTIKSTNYNGLVNIASISVAGSSVGGAFMEGPVDLEYFVKTFYSNKVLSGIMNTWDKTGYPTGYPNQFNTSQVKVNNKAFPYNTWDFKFVPTTDESPISEQYYKVIAGPVEVYQGTNNEHVLTYDPSTNEFIYYGRFI